MSRFAITSTLTLRVEGSPRAGLDLSEAIAEQTKGLDEWVRDEFGVDAGEVLTVDGSSIRVDISTVGEEFSS